MKKTVIIQKGSVFYHGSIHKFNPKNIKSPFWLSKYKNQAINHVCYKYNNVKKGILYSYRIKKDLMLIDISKDGSTRLISNAKGNYYLANLIKDGEFGNCHGYINIPEQGEIMLINNDYVEEVTTEDFNINIKVEYKNVNNRDWRMVENKVNKNNRYCCLIS